MVDRDPRIRFSDRVQDYVTYRPGYPPEVLRILRDEVGLLPEFSVADVGSGTGLFSKLLLEHGCRVYGVEPNAPMRAAAERLLGSDARYTSIDGSAEATSLATASVDFVTCAQAFHWFDPQLARAEFRRIARPGARAALLWNTRELHADEFSEAYEQLVLAYGTDYAQTRHDSTRTHQAIVHLFETSGYERRTFRHDHILEFDQLRGLLLSASYIPKEPNLVEELTKKLRALFDQNMRQGLVSVRYKVEIYFGTL